MTTVLLKRAAWIAAVVATAFAIGGCSLSASAGAPEPSFETLPAGAVRAILYEEDPNDPKGQRSEGWAIWRAESLSPGDGKPLEFAVQADIEIPQRQMSISWTLRRETKLSSTSHTIAVSFKVPPDFPPGGFVNVPGIWVKEEQQKQGVALAGLSVKVTDGNYLIGLSNLPADREQNLRMLRERNWFDLPIVYANKRRAILAFEKGPAGERAFAEAFAAWGK